MSGTALIFSFTPPLLQFRLRQTTIQSPSLQHPSNFCCCAFARGEIVRDGAVSGAAVGLEAVLNVGK